MSSCRWSASRDTPGAELPEGSHLRGVLLSCGSAAGGSGAVMLVLATFAVLFIVGVLAFIGIGIALANMNGD
jgi:hypothetical protein